MPATNTARIMSRQLRPSIIHTNTGDLSVSLQACAVSVLLADSFPQSLSQQFLCLSFLTVSYPLSPIKLTSVLQGQVSIVSSLWSLPITEKFPTHLFSSISFLALHIFFTNNQWLMSCWRTLLASLLRCSISLMDRIFWMLISVPGIQKGPVCWLTYLHISWRCKSMRLLTTGALLFSLLFPQEIVDETSPDHFSPLGTFDPQPPLPLEPLYFKDTSEKPQHSSAILPSTFTCKSECWDPRDTHWNPALKKEENNVGTCSSDYKVLLQAALRDPFLSTGLYSY